MDASCALEGDALAARFEALTAVLADGAFFWSTRPFLHRRVAWEDDLPALSAWVRARPPAEVYALEVDPFAADAPEPWGTFARRVAPLIGLGPLRAAEAPGYGPRPRQVKARKWNQVAGFQAVVEELAPPGAPIVEWCAGRGHLGRSLARKLGTTALLLERDPDLCRPPEDHQPDPARHAVVDVLDDQVASLLPTGAMHVSLHACGTLTDRALHHACARGAAVLAAPCCFHRLVGSDAYLPRSTPGAASGLVFERPDLRLATREACHANPRQTTLRAREMLVRAGWDQLRRAHTGVDEHHGLPRMERGLFDLGFAEFMERMVAQTGLALPAFEPAEAERAAAARVLEIRALDLPRMLFRRAIEVWIDLDRALAAQERGFRVRVGTFCRVEDSPRNIGIAVRADAPRAGSIDHAA